MAAGYNPIAVESAWYDWWQKEGFFKPQFTADGKVKAEGVFIIPAPPPNVTGSLHIGHGLTTAIQDTLIRWLATCIADHLFSYVCIDYRNRMLGKTTLFAPGFDHAGISTQSVVEKRLYKSTGKTRHDLGREKFLETVMDWKNECVFRFIGEISFIFFLFISTAIKIELLASYIDSAAVTTGIVLFLPWTRFVELFCGTISDVYAWNLETQQGCYREFLSFTRRRYYIPR
jgi:hypothetical protein